MRQTGNCAIFGVDPQNCFGHPKGGLYVPGGEKIIKPGNKLIAFGKKYGFIMMFSADWHLPNSTHFKPVGPWPPHGIAGTWDAEFLSGLGIPSDPYSNAPFVFFKGTGENENGYDPFEGHGIGGSDSPENMLDEYKIKVLIFWGLTTDWGVKTGVFTACRLAPKYGWKVYVAIDACRAVNANPGDEQKAIDEMRAAGAIITTTEEIINGRA